MEITKKQLASKIDHTLLRADAVEEDFIKLADEAKKYGFKMLAINSVPVKFCRDYLGDSAVHVGAAISFPLGQTSIATKVFEVKNAILAGADEIDYVINVGKLKEGNLAYIEEEMQEIVAVCHEAQVICKVILETCLLTTTEKIAVCQIARKIKPDFVKTSTGFSKAGATVEDVRLMKETVGNEVQVKAAGGIRDLETALALIEAGATRIGTSSGIAIIEALEEEKTR